MSAVSVVSFLRLTRIRLSSLWLTTYKAKVDEVDKMGMTPIQLATSNGHEELTKVLLAHGGVVLQP